MSIEQKKQDIRKYFLHLREQMSMERRLEASLACCSFLKEKLKNHRLIASFASKDKELNIWDLNLTLCSWGKLVLPKIEDSHITFYQVKNIESELIRSPLGIMEPNPIFCPKVNLEEVDAIVVPAISYDENNNRIGYGMGYYDRFLANMDEKLKLGVCYSEHKVKELPTQAHDVPVDVVFEF